MIRPWAAFLGYAAQLLLRPEDTSSTLQTTGSMDAVSFRDEWRVLGPFQIGTRGMTMWGSDPLERYGGFHKLQDDPAATFSSSLATNGIVKWTTLPANATSIEGVAKADLNVVFPEVDWSSLRAVYGWSANQYQAWARQYIRLEKAGRFEVYSDHIIEFWLDGGHYFGGDFYASRRAPLVVTLGQGVHRVEARVVYDVRSMGGAAKPTIHAQFELRSVTDELRIVDNPVTLISDVVDGQLASPYASVTVRNSGNHTQSITSIRAVQNGIKVSLISDEPLVIRPGQTRPVAFYFETYVPVFEDLYFVLLRHDSGSRQSQLAFTLSPTHVGIVDMHKLTYLHTSGIVSYGMLRPPQSAADLQASHPLPILVGLHGAGVEVADPMMSRSLDDVADLQAWTLLPSGVNSWSGDDWHDWGWQDVEAAIDAIPEWIERVGWQGREADRNSILLVGHSNGGQGVWYGLLHHSDRVMAAAPVSGYASVQKYVPYTMWHESDPRRTAVLQAILNDYRSELFLDHAKDTPIMIQHGGADDNVPTFHSRRMFQLATETGMARHMQYNEISGQGHWWDGVLTTDALKNFYHKCINLNGTSTETMFAFKMSISNPSSFSSVHGMSVRRLIDPGQLGHIDGRVADDKLDLQTSNIESFSIIEPLIAGRGVSIDGQEVPLRMSDEPGVGFVRKEKQEWHETDPRDDSTPRQLTQLGGLAALLTTDRPFTILCDHTTTFHVALQISRNLYQYFGADSEITVRSASKRSRSLQDPGNVISTHLGPKLHDVENRGRDFPVRIYDSTVTVKDAKGDLRTYKAANDTLGAIYLRPLPGGLLELVVWGVNEASLRMAARIIPLVTGVGQPDFVILTAATRWKGAEGCPAMGFFDSQWQVSPSSYLS